MLALRNFITRCAIPTAGQAGVRWSGLLALLLTSWLGLSGCHRVGCPLIQTDIDDLVAAGKPPTGFSNEQVRSGQYAIKIATGAEFAGDIRQTLGGACNFVPRRLRLRAWVFLKSGRIRGTNLVLTVRCNGRREDPRMSIPLHTTIMRYNKWERVQQSFTLPDGLLPTDELLFYCWHAEANGDVTYVDDVRIDALP